MLHCAIYAKTQQYLKCVFAYVSELNVASCVVVKVVKRVSVVFAKGFDQFHDILIIVKWPQDASVSF